MPQRQYNLLAEIQERAAKILDDAASIGGPANESALLAALRDPNVTSPALDIGGLLDRFQMFDLFDNDGLLDTLRSRVRELVKDFAGGRGFDRVIEAVRQIRKDDVQLFEGRLLGALTRQVGIGISFVTTLRNVANVPRITEDILEGWKEYFFGANGFTTIDGIAIVAPSHDVVRQITQGGVGQLAMGLDSLKGLKGMLNERSAEQYVRDVIRITVEVAGDARYSRGTDNLRARLRLLDEKVSKDLSGEIGAQNKEKAARWFKGAGSMAESLVTSAVEQAALGVSQFSTNPIIAATAATYAGTAARKATQHVFLSEVGV